MIILIFFQTNKKQKITENHGKISENNLNTTNAKINTININIDNYENSNLKCTNNVISNEYQMDYIKKYVEKTNSFLMEIYLNENESFSYVTLPKETLDIYTNIDQFSSSINNNSNNQNVLINYNNGNITKTN